MKYKSILAKEEREQVFELFIQKRELRFNEIEKNLGIKSNVLSYHLDNMIKESILEKKEDYYSLTKEAEKLIPSFAHIIGKEKAPLPIIVAAITKGNKICLLRRAKRPYQGYWGMIGGKIKHGEHIEETAVREAKEETGLDCEFKRISSIMQEHVKEDNIVKHAFLIFLCELKASEETLKQSEEGRIDWFDIKELPFKIIPSDKMMIETLLNKGLQFKKITLEEKEGELKGMKIE